MKAVVWCGTRAAFRAGCRCARCSFVASPRDKAQAAGLLPDAPQHGTRNGYNYWGCRCGPCTRAQADFSRTIRAKKPRVWDYEIEHGSVTAYSWHCCRCDECKAANTERDRRRRAARKAARVA